MCPPIPATRTKGTKPARQRGLAIAPQSACPRKMAPRQARFVPVLPAPEDGASTGAGYGPKERRHLKKAIMHRATIRSDRIAGYCGRRDISAPLAARKPSSAVVRPAPSIDQPVSQSSARAAPAFPHAPTSPCDTAENPARQRVIEVHVLERHCGHRGGSIRPANDFKPQVEAAEQRLEGSPAGPHLAGQELIFPGSDIGHGGLWSPRYFSFQARSLGTKTARGCKVENRPRTYLQKNPQGITCGRRIQLDPYVCARAGGQPTPVGGAGRNPYAQRLEA